MNGLETLEQHENRFWWGHMAKRPSGCGVACPECGAELWADSSELLLSDPPQTPIFCKECDWRGSMH